MNEKENVALVQQGYSFFSKGDIPGLLKLMSPNVTWELAKVDNAPFTGKHQGVEGVGRFFSAMAEAMDILKYEPREFIAQGNKVIVLVEGRYRVTLGKPPTGRLLDRAREGNDHNRENTV